MNSSLALEEFRGETQEEKEATPTPPVQGPSAQRSESEVTLLGFESEGDLNAAITAWRAMETRARECLALTIREGKGSVVAAALFGALRMILRPVDNLDHQAGLKAVHSWHVTEEPDCPVCRAETGA